MLSTGLKGGKDAFEVNTTGSVISTFGMSEWNMIRYEVWVHAYNVSSAGFGTATMQLQGRGGLSPSLW